MMGGTAHGPSCRVLLVRGWQPHAAWCLGRLVVVPLIFGLLDWAASPAAAATVC